MVVVHSVPGRIAPNWPDGTSQQMHLDFGVADGIIPETRTGSRVYASPAGCPFCLRTT